VIEMQEGAVGKHDFGAAVAGADEVTIHEHRAGVATIGNAFVNDSDYALDKGEIAGRRRRRRQGGILSGGWKRNQAANEYSSAESAKPGHSDPRSSRQALSVYDLC
jgi:hypothetical protein